MKPFPIRRWLVAFCFGLTLALQINGATHVHAATGPGVIQPESQPDDCRPQRHVCQCR